jgi:GntR family transcriptional regulator, transcriptional repressor for pyruvate dehydrogenase complex
VADQLRALIMTGEVPPGQRLPNEAALAAEFGVSRATIREALRVLSTQNLIRTAKGAGGGSFVTTPSLEHISDFMTTNINLLSQSENVTLDEFLEARELLEIPAARIAARRHDETMLERLRAAIPDEPLSLATDEQFARNRDFHAALVAGAGNTFLTIAAQPVFAVLQTNLKRSTLGRDFHETINHDHRLILEAAEAGDEEATAEEMRKHLDFLRPMYEKAWRYKRHRAPAPHRRQS